MDETSVNRRTLAGPPQVGPDVERLSDIELYRAWLRKVRHPHDPDTMELQAEMARRALEF